MYSYQGQGRYIIKGYTSMKVKTSITLSEGLIQEIDALSSKYGNRSALIEKAVRDLIAAEAGRRRDLNDLEILNQNAEGLNAEAEDALGFQVDL